VLSGSLGTRHDYLSFRYIKGVLAVQGHLTPNLACTKVKFELLSELYLNFWFAGVVAEFSYTRLSLSSFH